jgi:hypothetical protein
MVEPTPKTTSSANDRAAKRKANSETPSYQTADAALKEKMDAAMQPIISHIESILAGEQSASTVDLFGSFGKEASEQLGVMADQVFSLQQNFSSELNTVNGASEELMTKFSEIGLGGLVDILKDAGMDAADKGVELTAGTFKALKGIFDSKAEKQAKKENKKDKGQKLLADMEQAIPNFHHEMINIIDKVVKTEAGLNDVIDSATMLGYARIQMSKDLRFYIETGKEIKRRFEEEFIPEAKGYHEESGSEEDRLLVQQVANDYSKFIQRQSELEGSLAASIISATTLQSKIGNMEETKRQCQIIIDSRQNEMKAILAEATSAIAELKATSIVKSFGKLADTVQEDSMKISEEAAKQGLETRKRGTLDPAKLQNLADRVTKMVEAEHSFRINQVKELEKVQAVYKGIGDKLLEKEDANATKLLDSLTPAAKPTNDNRTATPHSLKKDNGPSV